MKKLITSITVCTLFICRHASAQAPMQASIKVIAKSWGDSISLRWAPTTPLAWRLLNEHGYSIERFTYKRNDYILPKDKQEKVKLAEVKVKTIDQWEPHQENKYVSIAAQAIFGESFALEEYGQGPLAIYNQALEWENRYSFTLFAADQDRLTASLAGLSFTDTHVKAYEEYLYIIRSLAPKSNMPIDSGFVLIATNSKEKVYAPRGLQAKFADHSVVLQWLKPQVRSPFTGYFVERSTDGKNFEILNEEAFVNPEQDERKSKYIYFPDSLPSNGMYYYYRVRGRTPFGELSPPTNIVKGKGGPQLDGKLPILAAPEVIDNKKVRLTWTFPEEKNEAIAGFAIFHSKGMNEKEVELTIGKRLTPKARMWEDKNPSGFGFYKVAVINHDGIMYKSLSVLAQLQDSIPPLPPTGLVGEVDSNGIVHVTWQQNTEKDFNGYQVYKSYHLEDQFVQCSAIIKDTSYTDSIPSGLLNPSLYIQVIALDWNINRSDFSSPLQIALPDHYPPTSPMLKEVISKDTGTYFSWSHSQSIDLAYETLYRRKASDSTWTAIARFKLDSNWHHQYVDKAALSGTYEYQIRATDVHGLESNGTQVMKTKVNNLSQEDALKLVEVSPNIEKGVMYVRWKVPSEATIAKYELYRSINEGPLRLLKILDKETKGIEDRLVAPSNRYSYRLLYIDENGKKSPLSKQMSNTF